MKPKSTSALYRRVHQQLVARFEREHPREARRATGRVWMSEHSTFTLDAPPQPQLLAGLPLYASLATARLKECGKAKPDWRLVVQLTRWLQRLEQAAARRPQERA